jgi:hypothetical protein
MKEPSFFTKGLPQELIKELMDLRKDQQDDTQTECVNASFRKFNNYNGESPFCDGCLNLFLSPLERRNHINKVNNSSK